MLVFGSLPERNVGKVEISIHSYDEPSWAAKDVDDRCKLGRQRSGRCVQFDDVEMSALHFSQINLEKTRKLKIPMSGMYGKPKKKLPQSLFISLVLRGNMAS